MLNAKKDEEKAIQLASKLGKEADYTQISNMEVKLPEMKRGPIAKIWDKVSDIYNGFMSDEVPSSIKVLLIGSLLYLVLPVDVIPDFIPVGGLLDDAAVLTYVWNKLSKLIKLGNHIAPKVVKQSISDKVQESITSAYNKTFEFGKNKLEAILKKKAKNTIKNSLMSLIAFIIAILFLYSGSREGALISSLIVIALLLRTIYSVIKTIPIVFKFLKIYLRDKDIDSAVSDYLKDRYTFINQIEEYKNKVKIFDGLPDLKDLVYLQRTALRKTIIEVVITMILAIVLVFVFKRVLIYYTDYNFIDILTLPFVSFINLFK